MEPVPPTAEIPPAFGFLWMIPVQVSPIIFIRISPSTMRGQKRWSTNWPPAALPPGCLEGGGLLLLGWLNGFNDGWWISMDFNSESKGDLDKPLWLIGWESHFQMSFDNFSRMKIGMMHPFTLCKGNSSWGHHSKEKPLTNHQYPTVLKSLNTSSMTLCHPQKIFMLFSFGGGVRAQPKALKVIWHSLGSSSTNLNKSSSYISPLWFVKPNSPEQHMLLFTTCFFRTEQAELFFLPGQNVQCLFQVKHSANGSWFLKVDGEKKRISHQTVSSKFMFFHLIHLQNVGTTTSLPHNDWTFPHWLRLPNISRCPRCPTCPTWRCDHWRKTRWTPPRCGSLHGCRRPGNKLNLYTSSKSNNCNKSIEHIHLLQSKVTNKSTGIYILLQKSAWQL